MFRISDLRQRREDNTEVASGTFCENSGGFQRNLKMAMH